MRMCAAQRIELLEVVFDLPEPMRFAQNCLGATFDFDLVDRRATLHLPTERAGGTEHEQADLGDPHSVRGERVLAHLRKRETLPDPLGRYWGQAWQWHHGKIERWAARRLFVTVPVHEEDNVQLRDRDKFKGGIPRGDALSNIGRAIERWWNQVALWCDALTVYTTRPSSRTKVLHLQGMQMWTVDNDNAWSQPTLPEYEQQSLQIQLLDDFPGVNRSTMVDALDYVDREVSPGPAASSLGLRADAGMRMTTAQQQSTLPPLPKSGALNAYESGSRLSTRRSGRRSRTKVERWDVYSTSCAPAGAVSLSQHETEPLLRVRNSSVHAGADPTANEAKAAIEVASALLDELVPLPG